MLIIWAAYVLAISTLLLAAAWAGERVLQSRGRATRAVWAAAFVGSFLSPLLGGLFVTVRDLVVSESAVVARALGPPRPASLHPVAEALDGAAVAGVSVDALFLVFCVVSSAGAFIWLWLSKRTLGEMAASWEPATWRGESVHLSEDMGPSVVGFLRPRMVVPTWVHELPDEQQELVLEHEREHLRVWDPRLSQLFLGLVCLMPWNVLLVVAYRRLRLAIEVDCDRRVVRRRGAIRAYGRTLLEAHSRVPAHGLGFLRRSQLEHRIRCLVGGRSAWVRVHDGLAVVGTAAAVLAFTLLPLPRRSVFGLQTVMGSATPRPTSYDVGPRLMNREIVEEGVARLERLARRLEAPESRVTFFLRIGDDGRVDRVYPGASSGSREVDALARRIASTTRWQPAREDGRAKRVWFHFRDLTWTTEGGPATTP